MYALMRNKKKYICMVLFTGLLSSSVIPAYSRGNGGEYSLGRDIGLSVLKSAIGGAAAFVAGTLIIKQIAKSFRLHEQKKLFDIVLAEPTRFSDVLGQDVVVSEVAEFVNFLKYPHDYTRVGAKRPKGLLLEGPPGNGKTLIARALAGEAGCCFISMNGADFSKKYIGEGPELVEMLFEFARQNAPAIIFIDEFDSIGQRAKEVSGTGAMKEFNNVVNKFLSKMDGFTQDDNVLVVGATNRKEDIDKALLRPGRFDSIVHVPQPTRKGREAILKHYINKITLDFDLCADQIAKEFAARTMGFSAADLERKIVNEAALLAGRDKSDMVTAEYFEGAYDRALLGLKTTLERNKQQQKHTAYHEAGHALVTVLTNLPITKVSIAPRTGSLGVSIRKQKYESWSDYNREELLNLIMVAQAGMSAEKLIFGQVNPAGGSSDIEHATDMANELVRVWGAGTGNLEGAIEKSAHSDAKKKEFDEEVVRILNQCKQKTESLLRQHKQKLINLAEGLLASENEELSEQEVYDITGVARPSSGQ